MKLTRMQQAQLRWRTDDRARGQAGFWFTLLLWAVTFVASMLLKPKPELDNAKPSGLGDFNFPTSTEGRVVPILWGTVKISGPNTVWYGDLRQVAIKEKVKTGMFSSETIIKGFQYFIGIQFAFCRGTLDALLRVWIGDDEVYNAETTDDQTFTIDKPELFGGEDNGNGGVVGTWRFHAGSQTQTADTYLSEFQSEGGDTCAYRGTAYICPDERPIYVGNSSNIKPWKFEVRRIPNGLGLLDVYKTVNDNDANPMNVIYEIMTDTDWGLGYDPTLIDTSNFSTAAATLAVEGNGFSMQLDNPREASELIGLVEEQIDGIVFFNQQTSQWQVRLARADYVPQDLDPITDENAKLENFARGSWENTTNAVRIEFNERQDAYKQTYAVAQDTANVRIQDDVNIAVTKKYPGVKDATLANSIAWRDLRGLSYPLAKVKVTVDRSFWATNPGDVFRFSWANLGITDLVVRVQRIDFGAIEENRIVLDCVQDVFYTAAPSFSDPGTTSWGDPLGEMTELDEAVVFEAPRAVVTRDPRTGGSLRNKIMVVPGTQGDSASSVDIRQRNSSGTPGGTFLVDGAVFGFAKVGTLSSSLGTGNGEGTSYPMTAVTITPTTYNDDQEGWLEAVTPSTVSFELGTELVNLLYIDDGAGNGEFLVFETAVANGANVDLQQVYRGMLDSAQQSHASGADVYLISASAGVSETDLVEIHNVDVKLTPRNLRGSLDEGSVTAKSLTMDRRVRRPYPPSEVSLNGVAWDSTGVILEANGTGSEGLHVDVDWIRRDYRVADSPTTISELPQLNTDAETLFPGFVAATSHDMNLEVRHDPTGTNDLILNEVGLAGTNYSLRRIDILEALNGAVPTGDLRVILTARHVDDGDTLTARQDLVFDFGITTALTGQFEFGKIANGATSAAYTATVGGTYNFTLSSAMSSSNVQYRLNGGLWATMITAGSTTGSITGVVATDTIEVRWLLGDTGLRQLDMAAPGAGQDGFAILSS